LITSSLSKKLYFFLPARGGSKGISKKNLQPIRPGISLVSYTLDFYNRFLSSYGPCVLSSDDQDILNESEDIKVIRDVRSNNLSSDNAGVADTIREFYSREPCYIGDDDWILVLEPTAPFRRVETFEKILSLINTNQSLDSVITGIQSQKVLWLKKNNEIYYQKLFSSETSSNRQSRSSYYIEANSFFGSRWGYLKYSMNFIGGNVGLVEVSEEESLDINNEGDLSICRDIARNRRYCD
jgi:CMP-N-acetylneuraminic acid synthetase